MLAARRQAAVFFAGTFALSWLGAALLVGPKLLRGEAIGKFDGLMMFPVMLLGPALMGLVLSGIFDRALRNLGRRLIRFGFPASWYLAFLLPFGVLWGVLTLLQTYVSPAFAPRFFWPGAAFGVVAGVLEEIGWTGFALPRLISPGDTFGPAVLLGLFWGLWHLPVLDFLGAATPHGAALVPFCLAFIFAMMAMRVIIAWVYVNTQSVAAAQLLHASSTAALVVFSPQVAPLQEALWYALYGSALWLVAVALVAIYGKQLKADGVPAS